MSVQGFLLKTYFTLEDKYYNLMDFFEKIRIPVYEFFIHPLENRRIPSFPVFIIIILIILGFLTSLLFQPQKQVLTLTIYVSGASRGEINFFQGAVTISKKFQSGFPVILNVSKGQSILKVSSAGFQDNVSTLYLNQNIVWKVNLKPVPTPVIPATPPSSNGVQFPGVNLP